MNKPPTKGLQFSLRSMLLCLPGIGVGALALTHPSLVVLQVLFTATILVFLSGFTVACFGRSHVRPFAFGLSLFGMSYIAVVGLVGDLDTRDRESTPLLTTRLLQHLYVPIAHPVPPPAGMGGGEGRYALYDPPEHLFRRIGHTVLAWILATIGGIFAHVIGLSRCSSRWFVNADERQDTSGPSS